MAYTKRCKHPNPEWRQRLGEIQDIYLHKTQDTRPPGQRNFRVTRRRASGAGRGRSSIIPEVHTSHAHEVGPFNLGYLVPTLTRQSSVTLEEIEHVSDFVDKLEKIELPNQLVASLKDPLLHKLLQLKPSVSTSQRIDQWLLAFFEDQLETPESEKTILEMLEAIRDYSNHTKVCSQYRSFFKQILMRPRNCLWHVKNISGQWFPFGMVPQVVK